MPVLNHFKTLSIQSTSATSVNFTNAQMTGAGGNVLVSGININYIDIGVLNPGIITPINITFQLSSSVTTTGVIPFNINFNAGVFSITSCKGDFFIANGGLLLALKNGNSGNPGMGFSPMTLTITCTGQSLCATIPNCVTAKATLIDWGKYY